MTVKWDELLMGFECASIDGMGGEAFLRIDTGAVLWRTAFDDEANELPDDIEDEAKYLRIPGKRELGLGKPLVLDFTAAHLPDDFDEVRRMFSRKGAYGRFKDLLARRSAIERWHVFEAEATEGALRDWCRLNDIAIAE